MVVSLGEGRVWASFRRHLCRHCCPLEMDKKRQHRKHGEARMEMLDLAQSVFGGAWRIDTWSDGRIQLVRTDADKEARHSAIFTEALNICRLRSVMHCSNRALRDNVDRTVRWDCFPGVWNWLGETLKIESAIYITTPLSP